MTDVDDPTRISAAWLRLREPADAAARAADLVESVQRRLADRSSRWNRASEPTKPTGPASLVIRDLGCGTGAMLRWLSGRLTGPQHWVLYDRDSALLAAAAASPAGPAADGAPITVRARQHDITALVAADLAGTGLVTASALLDLLTRDEVGHLAAACVGAGCPALLTLSVVGQVRLTPTDPLDGEIGAAFNAHQRRLAGGRRLLGPDAAAAAAEAFTRLGAQVQLRPSPWRLGPDQAELTAAWVRGWVAAAVEQRPDLATQAAGYLQRRLAAAAVGKLRAVVSHRDLLAYP